MPDTQAGPQVVGWTEREKIRKQHNMDARDLLNRMAEQERNFRQREFLAPYSPGSESVIVKMSGLNYRFGIRRARKSGLGVFKPVDPHNARFVRDADEELRRRYFDVLPDLKMILCFETDKGWVAFPMNLESSKRKLGLDCEVIVKNVTDCERFDAITVRFDGLHFWFDEMFAGADVIKSDEMRGCFTADRTEKQMLAALAQVKGVTPEDQRAFELAMESWKLFQKVTTEDRLRQFLEFGGGKLNSYVVRGENIEFKWQSRSGASYTSLAKKESMDVVSAGICLDPHDGTGPQDQQFHVKDLPFVIDEGERGRLVYRRGINLDDDDDYDDYDD
jgi:hypothetical protein